MRFGFRSKTQVGDKCGKRVEMTNIRVFIESHVLIDCQTQSTTTKDIGNQR